MDRHGIAGWLLFGLLVGAVPSALADRIQLTGGGEMKGVLVPDPAGRAGMVGVLTESSARPLPLRQDQIGKVVQEPGPLRDYLAKSDDAGDGADAHYQVGLWCEQKKLAGPAVIEFRKAVELDPENAQAHQKLGHVQVGDKWLTQAEARQAKGLVQFKGKWVTPDEKERREADEASQNDQSAWTRRLNAIKQDLRSQKPDVRREAESKLAETDDVAAIGPLVRVFGRETAPLRVLMFRTLDAIEGPESSAAIVNQYLVEPDSSVKAMALDMVINRPREEVQPRLLQTLKTNKPDLIASAASALAEMKAEATIPQLVNALVQYRDRTEWVPVQVASTGPSFVSGKTVTYAAQALPVTAPGAVAYQVVPGTLLNGVAMGGPQTRVEYFPTTVRDMLPNQGVHEALVRLTGQDFGFNAMLWKQWLATGRRVELPERRVPGP
jgi:hypothetical protein